MSAPARTFVAVPVTGFTVDTAARTIEGLAVPYGRAASKGGTGFRFEPGSLTWSDVGRVKLLMHHDMTRPVGKAVSLDDTAEGLRARFTVAPGPAGDEALALADHGTLDGLSVGVDFAADGVAEEQGVLVVRRADLREVSLTAMPAFDDARVTRVTASKGGADMPEDTTQGGTTAPETTDTALALTLTADEVAALKQMLEEGQRASVDPTTRAVPGQRQAVFATERPANPLAYTPAALSAVQGAIDARERGRFVAADPNATFATLTTGTLGAGRVWGANALQGPRLLHVAAGMPRQSADAIYAQFPQLTLPTATASVGEGTTLTEYASSTAGTLTMGRFGRFTDLSGESLIGADAAAITSMHRLGIALDMDKVLIDAVETAAGSAATFSADVPGAVRKALAKVMAATATDDPADVVVLVNPDDINLLQDVTPIGGQTIGERFQRFSGALVYPSGAVNTGFVTVANLRVGARYFEAAGLQTVTDTNVKTDVQTVATFLIGGYGITLTSGFAAMVDVVTP